MPEAEDLITDAARHATVFAQELWRRRRGGEREAFDLPAILQRLDLLITGAFGVSYPLRIAQPPPPTPFVRRLLRRDEQPAHHGAVPAS